jgi:hypothetical protein
MGAMENGSQRSNGYHEYSGTSTKPSEDDWKNLKLINWKWFFSFWKFRTNRVCSTDGSTF